MLLYKVHDLDEILHTSDNNFSSTLANTIMNPEWVAL